MPEKFKTLLDIYGSWNSFLLLCLVFFLGIMTDRFFPATIRNLRKKFISKKRKNMFVKASRHLQKLGYINIETNVAGRSHIKWNYRLGLSPFLVDMVAEKEGRIDAFLLRRGEEAQADNEKIRRELLDIFVNFEKDSLYLMNIDNMVINKVEFTLNPNDFELPEEEQIKNWHWVLIGLVFGYIVAKALSF